MRGNPDIFELRIDRNDFNASYRVSWRSRAFAFDRSLQLRHQWDADPRRLAEFIEHLVGDAVRGWAQLGVDGRAMAEALSPHWEREIFRHMERLEYESRRHPRYGHDDRIDAMRYSQFQDPRHWGPREDPKATEKARQLLLRNLDAGQESSFKKDKTFRVTAKDGKAYTISHARSFNVTAPDGTRYCGQLNDTPIEDQMLAQKLLLEHEPDKFFKNANVSPAPNGIGFVQSGTGVTATAMLMRQTQWERFP
jgi:hypothetical protein